MKERLKQEVLRIDPRVKNGYYSDAYFNRTKQILEQDNYRPNLRMQVFQRNDDACLCGIDEAIGMLREALGEDFKKIKIMALHDGDIVNAWETVMLIEGDYSLFAHLETVYLGALARGTKVATNVYRCVKAANGKPVLFFPARFDTYLVQAKDGYSYKVGREAASNLPVPTLYGKLKIAGHAIYQSAVAGGVSTDAQGEWWGSKGLGTIPHALIAAYDGDTVKAAMKLAEYADPEIKRVVLVDFDNDCVKTTMDVADAMFKKYQETKDERYKLFGVRLDTSGTMVDKSVREDMEKSEYHGSFKPTGVNPRLVKNVRNALARKMNSFTMPDMGYKFYEEIGIIVSGGFTPSKIKQFEDLRLPVSAYGVGSSLFDGNFDFTADIVSRHLEGSLRQIWFHNAKKGRRYNENAKLEEVK